MEANRKNSLVRDVCHCYEAMCAEQVDCKDAKRIGVHEGTKKILVRSKCCEQNEEPWARNRWVIYACRDGLGKSYGYHRYCTILPMLCSPVLIEESVKNLQVLARWEDGLVATVR